MALSFLLLLLLPARGEFKSFVFESPFVQSSFLAFRLLFHSFVYLTGSCGLWLGVFCLSDMAYIFLSHCFNYTHYHQLSNFDFLWVKANSYYTYTYRKCKFVWTHATHYTEPYKYLITYYCVVLSVLMVNVLKWLFLSLVFLETCLTIYLYWWVQYFAADFVVPIIIL